MDILNFDEYFNRELWLKNIDDDLKTLIAFGLYDEKEIINKIKENTMIDFNRLNEMIDEVNNVITDVKKDAEQTKKEGDNIKETLWANAHHKLGKMYKIYQNAIKDESYLVKDDLKIKIYIENGIIEFSSGGITLRTFNQHTYKTDSYYCIGDNYSPDSYKRYNHSHPSIIYFHDLASMWDDVEEDIESQFINGIHAILKQRSENAHKENMEAHEFLNSISNSI